MRQTVQLMGDNVKVDFMPGGSVPGAVTLAYPANSASNTQLPANLGWKSIKGATGYQLQVSTSQGFSTNILVDTAVTDTVLRGVVAPCGTRTYWRVRASNDNGNGPWSSAWSFTPARTTSSVAGIVGPKGPASSDGVLTFTWKAGTNTPVAYELQVMKGGTRFYADSMIADTIAAVPGFTEPGTYEWRVRPKNACGWHSWTSMTSFTLTITSVDENTPEAPVSLDVRPNPANDAALLYVSLPVAERVTIQVTDVTGRQMGLFATSLEAGTSTIPMSAILSNDGIATGMMTVSITSSTGRTYKNVAVFR
jgi:hypothetical protein